MLITIQKGDYTHFFDSPHEALIFVSWEYEMKPSAELRHIKETLLDWIRQGVDLKHEIRYNIEVIRKEDKLCQ